MGTVLLDAVIDTDYGQFDLVWTDDGGFDGDADRFFAGQENGLVGAADPSGVYINLARRSGGSAMRIILLDSAPALHSAEYEDVVEVSTLIPADPTCRWQTWAGETSGPLLGLTSGSYRLRVSSHGRDAGAEGEFAEGLVDSYLIEIWPAEPEPEQIIRSGTEIARYWHHQWGGRR